MSDELTPNDELVAATCPPKNPRHLRDQHRDVVKRTRPEGLGSGRKIGRYPSLDDYDNR